MTDEDEFLSGRPLARAKALRRMGKPQSEPNPVEPKPTVAEVPPLAPPQPKSTSTSKAARPHMVDIGDKPIVHREATAEGFLKLQPATLDALRLGTGPKGDPFPAAQVAGILAAKDTPRIIPLCHPLPLTGIEVDLFREAGGVRCRATVRTDGKTGVEMEALAAVSVALLTVWDMTKGLEKDENGQYPATSIDGIRVVSKVKEARK